MKRCSYAVGVLLLIFAGTSFADVVISGLSAVQFRKKNGEVTTSNLDNSFIRAEVNVASEFENGITGLVHLRSEPKFGQGTSGINLQPRQIFFTVPVSILQIQAGRWYERYTVGNSYFGRYLHGVGATGNGAMNCNYNVVDGIKTTATVKPIKSDLRIGVQAKDFGFENCYLLTQIKTNPIKPLTIHIGGNFNIVTPDSIDGIHRYSANMAVTIIEKMKFMLFLEHAITDLSNASDNNWFMFGLSSKAGAILDRVQLECEVKKDRIAGNSDADFAWMLLLKKKFLEVLTIDLNIGADPTYLGSTNPGEVGGIMRTTLRF